MPDRELITDREMHSNPYRAPQAPFRLTSGPRSSLPTALYKSLSRLQIALVVLGLTGVYWEGKIAVLGSPQYLALFVLLFLAGAPGAFFRPTPRRRLAAGLLNLANLFYWQLFVPPLLQHPRPHEWFDVFLGGAAVVLSAITAVAAAVATDAPRLRPA